MTFIGFVVINGAEAFDVEFPPPHAERTAKVTIRMATAATVDRYEKTDRPLRWAAVEPPSFARRNAKAEMPLKKAEMPLKGVNKRERTGICRGMELLVNDGSLA